jgi:adenylate cyclase
VIAGEVGGSKRDIVFHGDVMNTTSRLEQVARELGRPFVVSGDALGRLANTGQYALDDLGEHALRGRTSPIRVYAVAASPPAAPPAQSLAITAPK